MRHLWLAAVPLLAACQVHRVETGSAFASYTQGWSVPVYGPDGAMQDNEPEHEIVLVHRRERGLDHAVRLSVGEGTLVPDPQEKVFVYSATWGLRAGVDVGTRWRLDGQVGPRIAFLEHSPGAVVELGPDAEVAFGRRLGKRSSFAFHAGLWWAPTGNLPRDVHTRFGLRFGWDF